MSIRLTNPIIDNILALDYEMTIKQDNVKSIIYEK